MLSTSRLYTSHKSLFLLYRTQRSLFNRSAQQAPRYRPSPDPLLRRPTEPTLSPKEAASLIQTLRSRSNEPIQQVSYVRPLVFGSLFCTCAFVGAGYVYEQQQQTLLQRWVAKFRRSDNDTIRKWWETRSDKERQLVWRELWREKLDMMNEKKQASMDKVMATLKGWQQVYGLPEGIRRLGVMVVGKLATMTESERTMLALIGLNVLVFGAWQVPRWTPFMARWFMHHPGSHRPITLITSCFSHKEGLHLACNMFGLYSFGTMLHDYFGREQFLALYLSTGVGANMASHVLSLMFRRSRPLLPSLGASGAIYGLLSGFAYLEPQAGVSLIFLPFVTIKLGYVG
ncbi:hypothetical protein BC941DRAFT_440944 [Chlamydoabsidia padenii]|nr:hypothetical protein BC941DRAFT_440944 [Chlamydoabsidia padenii]